MRRYMSGVAAGWENFFVAEVGAAAALSGLIFVAVSINLNRILTIPHLPERAGETLILLMGVLTIASFGLVPGQTGLLLGPELASMGLLVSIASIRLQRRVAASPSPDGVRWLRLRIITTQASSLPFVIAGVGLFFGYDRAIGWVVPGTVASFGASMLNAWVLLVEIQR
jgi:hypothetical protein